LSRNVCAADHAAAGVVAAEEDDSTVGGIECDRGVRASRRLSARRTRPGSRNHPNAQVRAKPRADNGDNGDAGQRRRPRAAADWSADRFFDAHSALTLILPQEFPARAHD